MKVLVVGSGAREHALVWKLVSDPKVTEVICAPGNAGITEQVRCVSIDATDVGGLLAFAKTERVVLTVVGPEQPLARGIADAFTRANVALLGPSEAASRLETSKAFAKTLMARLGVPTARYRVCATLAAARAAIEEFGAPVVVKADGLAAGKGVTVAPDVASALRAVDSMMVERQFGDAGATVVIEECLSGPEVSIFALVDGQRSAILGAAQDHKCVFDDDQGPNTGGMGAFTPSPLVTPELEAHVAREIIDPIVAGLAEEGHPYVGFLYAGLMLTSDGPKVIEFNVRLGDPEAQVVLPALQGSFAPYLLAAAEGHLMPMPSAPPTPHVGVVLASGGYPGQFSIGKPITGLDSVRALGDTYVFHAGTKRRDDHVVTSGGRVLTVVGCGHSFEQAIARAYAAADVIQFEGKYCRRDIGRKAIIARDIA